MQQLGVKICGLKNKADALCAQEAGAKFIGFIFFPKSVRNIKVEEAKQIVSYLDKAKTSVVAVMVNPDDDFLTGIVNNVQPDYLQLHGNESVERVREIKKKFGVKIIKAFPVSKKEDLQQAEAYTDLVDLFLFDSKDDSSGYYGGSGKSFSFTLLENYKAQKPWFLSGGINLANIDNAIEISGSNYIDISSGVEAEKGVKSQAKIQELFKHLKQKYELT